MQYHKCKGRNDEVFKGIACIHCQSPPLPSLAPLSRIVFQYVQNALESSFSNNAAKQKMQRAIRRGIKEGMRHLAGIVVD